jgi:hypothetical protein
MKTINLKGTYVNASPKSAKFGKSEANLPNHSQIVAFAEAEPSKVKIMQREQ